MGYRVSFTDNEVITAEMLNAIRAELGDGVEVSEAFADDTTYSVDKLNAIRADMVDAGVLEGLACMAADGRVKIGSGLAVFANGMRMAVDAEGAELNLCEGKSYVYLYRSESQQFAMPVVSETMRESTQMQEYLPLCEVEEGAVTDKRRWSISKIPLLSGNHLHERSAVVTPGDYHDGTKIASVELPDDCYTFAEFDMVLRLTGQLGEEHYHGLRGFCDFSSGSTYGNTRRETVGSSCSYVLEKNGAQLELWIWPFTFNYVHIESGTVTFKAS